MRGVHVRDAWGDNRKGNKRKQDRPETCKHEMNQIPYCAVILQIVKIGKRRPNSSGKERRSCYKRNTWPETQSRYSITSILTNIIVMSEKAGLKNSNPELPGQL